MRNALNNAKIAKYLFWCNVPFRVVITDSSYDHSYFLLYHLLCDIIYMIMNVWDGQT